MDFNSKVSKPEIVALKAKAFLLEAVGNPQLEEIKLEAEHKWLGSRQEDKFSWDRASQLLNQLDRLEFQRRNFQNDGN